MLRDKYARQDFNSYNLMHKPADSSLWKAIVALWPYLVDGEYWAVGKSDSVSVWYDRWISAAIIKLSNVMQVIPDHVANYKVNDMVKPDGQWDFELLSLLIPQDIIKCIKAIIPPRDNADDDRRLWTGNKLGEYFVASGYNQVNGFQNLSQSHIWNKIWKIKAPERIKVFIWQVTHERLLTNSCIAHRGNGQASCHHCVILEENILHVLRDCPLANLVWLHLLDQSNVANFFYPDLMEWIDMNLSRDLNATSKDDWQSVWAQGCYFLWYWRNQQVHNSSFVRPFRLWESILQNCRNYKILMVHMDSSQVVSKKQIMIKWMPPDQRWYKLNSDGLKVGDSGGTGYGGLIRDENGRWVVGFVRNLGIASAYVAKSWGVLEGVTLARQRVIDFLEINVDSKVVVDGLKGDRQGCLEGWTIVGAIRKMVSGLEQVKISHIYREANQCADLHVNHARTQEEDLMILEHPIGLLTQLLLMDSCGVETPHVVVV